jgi:hypothetical protein
MTAASFHRGHSRFILTVPIMQRLPRDNAGVLRFVSSQPFIARSQSCQASYKFEPDDGAESVIELLLGAAVGSAGDSGQLQKYQWVQAPMVICWPAARAAARSSAASETSRVKISVSA